MKRTSQLALIVILLTMQSLCFAKSQPGKQPTTSDLYFTRLSTTWDEGIPLGNATLGALVWQHKDKLRFSLDRTDLWDLRPIESFKNKDFNYQWICKQVMNNDYKPVQELIDDQYNINPAPTKIPGAALEFPLNRLGEIKYVRLYLKDAVCEIIWKNGTRMLSFVHAGDNIGWFRFENLPNGITPDIIAPQYQSTTETSQTNSQSGETIDKLGYKQGTIVKHTNSISYHQPGWGTFSYDVAVQWKQAGKSLTGVWSISSSLSRNNANEDVSNAIKRGFTTDYNKHMIWWTNYWKQSSINIPDSVLQKQYDNEVYKFGSAAHEDSYPISLQAVWTADNGKLPPWKGDFHHDLNTQLSYWPCYTGNHLKEGLSYLNTLWNQRNIYKNYTKSFFGTDGINVPGVCALQGEALGGWAQYSFSPTVGAWIAQHFYLHWKYSADNSFLRDKAWPFVSGVARHLEQLSVKDENGKLKFPLSSSPEIFDNTIHAWFKTITNYDLSLTEFVFKASEEMADSLHLDKEAAHWRNMESQLPEFDTDETGALTFAKGFPYNKSHRHFSHAMAIHPLGLIDWSQGEKSQKIIKATLKKLDDYGPDWWCGYSYAWLGSMKARAFDGEGSAKALKTFAQCFCLPNTFHANGDQSKSGKSKFSYRPFTLEGNFAFAAGIQEMLLQSHTGIIHVFPSIPDEWKDVSFKQLRAMGAFLVSATKKNGNITEIQILPEKGGTCRIVSPFKQAKVVGNASDILQKDQILTFATKAGKVVTITGL